MLAVADALPKSQCPNDEDGMTYDMQTIALNAHNYYRRLTATGWAQDSKGYAPRAKKMQALKYDCTNAGAESKNQAHDCTKIGQYTAKAGYSLNYATFDYTVSEQDALEKAIGEWFGQLKNVDLGEEVKYTNDIKTSAKDFANVSNYAPN
ncbi:hypothetical protein ANCCAN_03610 [Ancylostoma caninum]|uniref:SCP domain-containing protein n=1 Tax=Ancylostoma caninum TaxID=29170 RepID=A0A368H1B2_ANCCA|nr:hypothetical protein ANCCAN_03610 [Ancylostoma caninum]